MVSALSTRCLALVPIWLILALLCAAGPAGAQEECEDEILAWSVEDIIHVEHIGAWYNCCAELAVEMETPEPGIVDFLESETYPEGPCYCECCISVGMIGRGFEPGTYLVRVWNEDRTELFGEAIVVVEGEEVGPGVLDSFGQSPCGGYSSLDEDDPDDFDRWETWGRIKEFFRE